jgi:hypothetical protein
LEAYRDLVDDLSLKNLPIGFTTKSLATQSFNPTLSSSDAHSEHQTIDPIKDIDTLSKKQEVIILFELLSLDYVEKLKIDQSPEHAKVLISIINSSSSEGIPQSIELDGHNFYRFVSKVNIYLCYNYGEFAQLIFICALKIDANQKESINNAEDAISKRKNTIEKIQKEIESQIPTVMHGFYFNNQLLAIDKPFKLPSLYVYNANIFSSYLKERTKDPRTL